jgi:hypothetical protein
MKSSAEYLYLWLFGLHQTENALALFREASAVKTFGFTIFSASAPRQAPWM